MICKVDDQFDLLNKDPDTRERSVWFVLVGIAVAAGVYFRFLGISNWPFAVDEYYIFQSARFVAESGVPAFPCGGYYGRGLLLQYLSAPLLGFGFAPEGLLRFITAFSSLLTLPAIYLLASRVGGLRLAAIATIVISLSTWEIEMARFARMYAPFQALFVWYCYHAFRLVDDREQHRWMWLLLFSAVAPLVWEGGVTLAILNFVLVAAQKDFRWARLAAVTTVLAWNVGFLSIDFRSLGTAPGFVDSSLQTETLDSAGRLIDVPIFLFDRTLPLSAELALVLATLVCVMLIVRFWWIDRRPLAALTMLALAGLITLNQIMLACMVLVGAVLTGWLETKDLGSTRFRSASISIVVLIVGWSVAAILMALTANSIEPLISLVKFPDLLRSLLWPWLTSMPIMTVLLAIGLVLALVHAICGALRNSKSLTLLLAFLLAGAFVIGGGNTPFDETRYSFFLYPVLILLALCGYVATAARFVDGNSKFSLIALAGFALAYFAGDDFMPKHLWTIDSYNTNFRVDYRPRVARHYYSRHDFRSAADFVNRTANGAGTIISTDVVTSHYLRRNDYIYLSSADRRYKVRICADGLTERWTNVPAVSSQQHLKEIVDTSNGGPIWLIVDHVTASRDLSIDFVTGPLGMREQHVSQDGRLRVFRRAEEF